MSVLLINLQIQYFSWICPETWGTSSKIFIEEFNFEGSFPWKWQKYGKKYWRGKTCPDRRYCVVQSLSCVQLFATPWTVVCQAPVHGIFQAVIPSGLPFPAPVTDIKAYTKAIITKTAVWYIRTKTQDNWDVLERPIWKQYKKYVLFNHSQCQKTQICAPSINSSKFLQKVCWESHMMVFILVVCFWPATVDVPGEWGETVYCNAEGACLDPLSCGQKPCTVCVHCLTHRFRQQCQVRTG